MPQPTNYTATEVIEAFEELKKEFQKTESVLRELAEQLDTANEIIVSFCAYFITYGCDNSTQHKLLVDAEKYLNIRRGK